MHVMSVLFWWQAQQESIDLQRRLADTQELGDGRVERLGQELDEQRAQWEARYEEMRKKHEEEVRGWVVCLCGYVYVCNLRV